MDRNVLKAQMRQRFEVTMEAALTAVEQAPDGHWIAGSEWQVREAFQALTADCYQAMVQGRVDDQPSAKQAAFSPSGQPRGSLTQQRTPRGPGADGQR